MTSLGFDLGFDRNSMTIAKEHQKVEQDTRRPAFVSANGSTSSLASSAGAQDRHGVVSFAAAIHEHCHSYAYVLPDGQIPPQTMYTKQMARATK
jgi:hypothetical protein